MELYDLQNEINKLYDKNYKLKTVDYNYLLHNTTKFKEMEATVFIYDHMIFNNVKPDSDTYDLINRLHSKTIYENNKIYIKKSLKKKLKPRRRIHKIMKGYNYSENYQEALIHLDIVKKYLNENPNLKSIQNKIKLAKNISKNCGISIKNARYIITNLKKTKFLTPYNIHNQNTILNYFKKN
jgi:hypothetical protein